MRIIKILNVVAHIALYIALAIDTYNYLVKGIDLKVFNAFIYLLFAMGVYSKAPLVDLTINKTVNHHK